jgi:hypothetical protein
MSSASGEKPSFFARISKAVATKLPNNNKDTTNTTNSPTSPATTTTTTTTTSNTPASPTSTTPSSSSTSTQPRRQHHRTDSSQLDVSTAWRWQQRAVASALAPARRRAQRDGAQCVLVIVDFARATAVGIVAQRYGDRRGAHVGRRARQRLSHRIGATSVNGSRRRRRRQIRRMSSLCKMCGATTTSGKPICAKCVCRRFFVVRRESAADSSKHI